MDKYFATKISDCDNIGLDRHAALGSTDIYITTFNNTWFVEYQIKTLRKFFLSPFNIIIVDTNQNLHPEVSAKVRATCEKEWVMYLKAPDNHYQEQQFFDPTLKLGTTLSFLFHNVIKKRRPTYFGFLDHDCFLFRSTTTDDLFIRKIKEMEPFSFNEYSNKEFGMYGTVSRTTKDDSWNLHVIANFFKFDFVKDLPLDFRASYRHQLDTGGASYEILYKHHNMEDYILPHIGVRYTDEDICRKDAVQHYEIIDNKWFHVAATSHDQLVGDGEKKLLYARGFLEGVLRTADK